MSGQEEVDPMEVILHNTQAIERNSKRMEDLVKQLSQYEEAKKESQGQQAKGEKDQGTQETR